MDRIGLGGGCHWCVEAVLQALAGVHETEQGFISPAEVLDDWAEAVIITFDEEILPLSALIEIHLRTHNSTRPRSHRSKYRSAIYVIDDDQRCDAVRILADLRETFDKELTTEVLPLARFNRSDQRLQNYYSVDPERPFCKTYIDPKLDFLRRTYSQFARPVPDETSRPPSGSR